MKPLTKIISLLVVSSAIYAVEIKPQEFTLEILDSDSHITVMTGGKATWDDRDVQVVPRYVPSEVGEMIVWGVRYNNVRRNSIKKGDEF